MTINGVSAPQWISPREAARRLSLSVSFVRKAIRDGRLRPRRVRGSRLLRLSIEEVDRLLEEAPLARILGT